MTFRFFKAACDPETRLNYCLPGPIVFIAGWVTPWVLGLPALAISLILAGASAMRIQASMIERGPGKSFRNAAGFLVLFAVISVVLGALAWAVTFVITAAGLFFLQLFHENHLKREKYASGLADFQQRVANAPRIQPDPATAARKAAEAAGS